MATKEFKPLDPFELYELFKTEFSRQNPRSLKSEMGFPPSQLKHFLNDESRAASAHRADLPAFRQRVSKVGLFVTSIEHLCSGSQGGSLVAKSLAPEEIGAYREFHNRLGAYAIALEDVDSQGSKELKIKSGNVACSVNPFAWKEYGEFFDIPEKGIEDYSQMTDYIQSLVNNSLY